MLPGLRDTGSSLDEGHPLNFFRAVAILTGAILFWRAAHGPFRAIVTVASPLNAQCFFGASAAISMALARAKQARPAATGRWTVALVFVAAVLAYWWARGFWFVSDELVLLHHAHDYGLGTFQWSVTHMGGDGFYRPLGSLWYAMESQWCRLDPGAWRAGGLSLHLMNTALLFALARRLAGQEAALWAAALFALHGSRPEAVVYIAARFDLLATAAVLGGLLLFTSGRRWAAAGVMAVGLLIKEIAFVFPLLALLCAEGGWRARLRATWPLFTVAFAMFAWRWRLAGGLGGYRDAAGGLQALHFSALGYLKAFGMRIWSVFFFPINWSREPEAWLAAALALGLCGYVILTFARSERRVVWIALGFTLVAVLPVAHLALIGTDLYGAPRLYLASAGFAMLLGAAGSRTKAPVLLLLLVFHTAALEHNLLIWRETSEAARRTCVEAAGGRTFGPLPRAVNGVPFLGNGFSECVALARGNSLTR